MSVSFYIATLQFIDRKKAIFEINFLFPGKSEVHFKLSERLNQKFAFALENQKERKQPWR
ncbi:hypothetical protein T4E_6505 [Trichinella pseudospiralis]|uniref:Uncharacterized protein n=1 Tax=Trichinella pseudospiralis TaxID=6337 RepID=A0A0V0Y5P6_TRIPS|nr:hypothetical protein T4E_6505 [Trichinella pseudospiralis]